uniref:Centromere protein X n=1 Tax=Sinocyclocheilus anshuiensis TaxID=1608454 RepID=A0A671KLF6_9TELE
PRVSNDAVILVAEMLKVFVEEATRRAVKQADSEDCDNIDIEHFEKILPQLVILLGLNILDFTLHIRTSFNLILTVCIS